MYRNSSNSSTLRYESPLTSIQEDNDLYLRRIVGLTLSVSCILYRFRDVANYCIGGKTSSACDTVTPLKCFAKFGERKQEGRDI